MSEKDLKFKLIFVGGQAIFAANMAPDDAKTILNANGLTMEEVIGAAMSKFLAEHFEAFMQIPIGNGAMRLIPRADLTPGSGCIVSLAEIREYQRSEEIQTKILGS